MEQNSKYFEGILQLRNTNDEIIEAAAREIEKKEKVFVSKTKKTKNGIDIYLSSNRFLRALANKLHDRFGGQLEASKKLHTKNRQTSREVYRVNILLRLPNFKKGDIVGYKGDKIQVVGMNKKVLAKNIETGKKLTLSYKDLIK